MELRGRREIFTDVEEITKENICQVMDEAFEIHSLNAAEITYLQEYEKGRQPVLDRIKEVRPEINFKAVENHATEITTFKVGYVFGSPITYVQRATVDADGNNADVEIETFVKNCLSRITIIFSIISFSVHRCQP
jgi:hypothetical protein